MALDSHACHAYGCETEIPPRMFFCLRHWRMLPFAQQTAIWREYRPGQEVDKRPSADYLTVTRRAIAYVARAEGMPVPAAYQAYLEP